MKVEEIYMNNKGIKNILSDDELDNIAGGVEENNNDVK